ncbi:hypothetical protein VTK73DRAFT_4220 [Phialemonium thermophilum]|uniref:Secreted protein n=1 Tax=Phialemonium thermophilum TaxID=223376 RepID=A0ABR3VAH9_9PEZI
MPAFWSAISSSVSPRKDWWSRPILAMTVTALCGSQLVASSRPPRPTSTTPYSTFSRRNTSNAVAVSSSNSVAPTRSSRSLAWTSVSTSRNRASDTGCPFTSMQSQRSIRWGEAHIEPLPLVPATWMAFQVCGVFCSRRPMRASPRSIMVVPSFACAGQSNRPWGEGEGGSRRVRSYRTRP